ncbi:MAG: DsbA family oxidoreductase [Alphaproteobacteria bacterium]|nr:DsbA family oxidoreductase [Alphaproteobacteria bacterium]
MKTLQIDVVSDVVCPWCYVGLKRLEHALLAFAERHPDQPPPEVRWHPFQLNPDLAPEGMDRAEYVQRKFGARSGDVYGRVAAVGKQVGIDFCFDGIRRQPNTLVAHSLIAVADPGEAQNRLVQALFDAYFIDSLDLTDVQVLAQVARQAGLAEDRIEAALNDEGLHNQVSGMDEKARSLGISGVPFFIFNGELAVSGAQESEQLLGAMEQASAPA